MKNSSVTDLLYKRESDILHWGQGWICWEFTYIKLQVCLSMCDLLLTSCIKGLNLFLYMTKICKMYSVWFLLKLLLQNCFVKCTIIQAVQLLYKLTVYMWCFARFGTICAIWKMWKTPKLKPATLLKVPLLDEWFSRFLIVQMVSNRAKRLIDTLYVLWAVVYSMCNIIFAYIKTL